MSELDKILGRLITDHHVEGLTKIDEGGSSIVYSGTINGVRSAFKISREPLGMSQGLGKKELDSLGVVKKLSDHARIVSLFDHWQVEGGVTAMPHERISGFLR